MLLFRFYSSVMELTLNYNCFLGQKPPCGRHVEKPAAPKKRQKRSWVLAATCGLHQSVYVWDLGGPKMDCCWDIREDQNGLTQFITLLSSFFWTASTSPPWCQFAWGGLHPVFKISLSLSCYLLFFLIVAAVVYGVCIETLPSRVNKSHNWNNISSRTESWTKFYRLLGPLKRNVNFKCCKCLLQGICSAEISSALLKVWFR